MEVKEPKGFDPVAPVEKQINRISCVILLVTSLASGCIGVVLLLGGLLGEMGER